MGGRRCEPRLVWQVHWTVPKGTADNMCGGPKWASKSYWKNRELHKSSDVYNADSKLQEYYRTRFFAFMLSSRQTDAHRLTQKTREHKANEQKVYDHLFAHFKSKHGGEPLLKSKSGASYTYSETDARRWYENLDEIVLHVQVGECSDATRAYELPAAP